ncbi:hypothetical protein B0H13DRAFT_2079791, partial [Mycena leptocephala]
MVDREKMLDIAIAAKEDEVAQRRLAEATARCDPTDALDLPPPSPPLTVQASALHEWAGRTRYSSVGGIACRRSPGCRRCRWRMSMIGHSGRRCMLLNRSLINSPRSPSAGIFPGILQSNARLADYFPLLDILVDEPRRQSRRSTTDNGQGVASRCRGRDALDAAHAAIPPRPRQFVNPSTRTRGPVFGGLLTGAGSRAIVILCAYLPGYPGLPVRLLLGYP